MFIIEILHAFYTCWLIKGTKIFYTVQKLNFLEGSTFVFTGVIVMVIQFPVIIRRGIIFVFPVQETQVEMTVESVT